MKQQLIHPSLRGSIINTFSFKIKSASLKLVTQMLSFGRFPQWNLYSTLQRWLDHHLTPLLNRPRVLLVLSSGLIPIDKNFFHQILPLWYWTRNWQSSIFILFPGDYDNLLQGSFSKIIHIGIRDQLDPLNTWTKTIQSDQDPAYRKPTFSTRTGIATILINNFIPHSKLFNETEGFPIDSASYIEIKFSDTPALKPHTQISLFFPFP